MSCRVVRCVWSVVMAVICLQSVAAWSGPERVWQPTGPDGGRFTSIHRVKDKSLGELLYLDSFWTGLFVSDNQGKSWRASVNGLPEKGRYYNPVFINKNVAFIVVEFDVYKTIDGGFNWVKVMGEVDSNVYELAAASEQVVYAATSTHSNTFYKTIDGGNHWFKLIDPRGKSSGPVLALSENKVLAVDSGKNTVWRTLDGGKHWKKMSINGLPNLSIQHLQLVNDTIVALTQLDESPEFSLYQSHDDGDSWQKLSVIKGDQFYAADFKAHGVGFVSLNGNELKKTIDNGKTWRTITPTIPASFITSILVLNESEVYLTSITGVYQSMDGGEHWQQLKTGMSAHEINHMASADGQHVFMVTNHGLFYRSNDAGRSWELIYSGQLFQSSIFAVAPTRDKVIYVYQYGGGVLKSKDNGVSWEQVLPAKPDTFFEQVELVAPSKKRIYLNESHGFGQLRTMASKDGGDHWLDIGIGLPGNKADYLVVQGEKELYALVANQIYHSLDAGSHWTLFATIPGARQATFIYIKADGTLFVAFEDDLLYYRSFGKTWETVLPNWPTDLDNNNELRRDELSDIYCKSNSHCFISFAKHGVYESWDSGASWVAANQGLPLPEYYSRFLGLPEGLLIYQRYDQGQVYRRSLSAN